jgi:ubiquinone biosynthesis accessory factor UbiK
MLDSKQLEELAARLARILPPGLKGLRAELEDNFRAVLRANLDRLELVSRERFDTQAELLARTQAKLAALEKRLKSLEKKFPLEAGAPQAGQPTESLG